MIVGIGSDLVRIARLEAGLDRFGQRLAQRLFTPLEITHCQAMSRPAACYAKRFAAKEALVKALGTGMRGDIWFRDVEVYHDEWGAPHLRFSGGVARQLARHEGVKVHVSLSDEGEYALAFVIIETT